MRISYVIISNAATCLRHPSPEVTNHACYHAGNAYCFDMLQLTLVLVVFHDSMSQLDNKQHKGRSKNDV